MKYLHTMVRVNNLEASLRFYCDGLGLIENRRVEHEAGRFTLVFLSAPNDQEAQIELTYNWDPQELSSGTNFGHLAYRVENIYQICAHLAQQGVEINRPPRDGYMAFVKSPEGISIELLQEGGALPAQAPWKDMPNKGDW